MNSPPLADRLWVTPVGRKVGQVVNNWFYTWLHRSVDDDVLFMNWCYEEDPPMEIPLSDGDELDRYAIQLYHAVVDGTDLTGKQVLEVGCGRGGGASYLTRTYHPHRYIGLDISHGGIEFCRRRHHVDGLEFVQGDAMDLPFADESFDVVINIESSHCYPNLGRFLYEVRRVLVPGGVFLYADVRRRFECTLWDDELRSRFSVVSCREINAEVLAGMELNSGRWELAADEMLPRMIRRWGRRGVPGRDTSVSQIVIDDVVSYRMYRMTKPG
ncbi:phthiotriol/phenolphthiotriol dimycocerosates methyltransferase [Mycobacterium sp. 1274761.0]|uniref:phthiotriol/phenolphthiotriol dimycocerosates methyltransferase n=1 Tax=Mycobacterium sp. 1274761.0 TaxID=1834077 RepID=UPI0007FE7FB2|nr:class I SAM-dependent methyltransferase [Mycobacterium sp. 1274761.0]OBK79195.1 hypothetical protein A5651_24385 [Mycobacterium sp. 1274761.0]